MKLIIEDDEGRKTSIPLGTADKVFTIGRQEDNAIRLTERNVSRTHAKLTRVGGQFILEDQHSYSGVTLNGRQIQGQVSVAPGDIIGIGDYELVLEKEAEDEVPAQGQDLEGDAPPTSLSGVPSQRMSTSIISLDDPSAYDTIPSYDLPIESAPRLVVQSGDSKGKEFAFIRTVLTLGRDFENDISIDHRSLSRKHCKFVRLPNGEWKIIDLGSANGIEVNGERYEVSSLASGDTIMAGKVKLCFFLPGAGMGGGAGGGLPKGLIIGGAVGLAAVIGLVVFLAFGRKAPPPAPVVYIPPPMPPAAAPASPSPQAAPPQAAPAASAAPDRAAPLAPVASETAAASAPVPAAASEASAAAPAPRAPEPRAPVRDASDAEGLESMKKGKALLDEGKYAEAVQALTLAVELKMPGAEELQEKAADEAEAADCLAEAADLFEAGNLDDAEKRLADIAETSALAREAKALAAKIEKAQERKAVAAAKAAAAKDRKKPQTAPKKRHPYGSNYVEIPAAKMKVLDGYLGEMCDSPDPAIKLLNQLLRENPDYGDAVMFLGSCYIEKGMNERGSRYYRDFLARWPKHPDAEMVRASLK